MKIETEKLLTPNSYRKKMGLARSTVYKQIERGELKTLVIDGVFFIVTAK